MWQSRGSCRRRCEWGAGAVARGLGPAEQSLHGHEFPIATVAGAPVVGFCSSVLYDFCFAFAALHLLT